MLKDIAYDELKKNPQAYEIMLLRDQKGKTFTAIASAFQISSSRASQIYNQLKVKQIRLYINHISVVLGYENTAKIRKVFHKAASCYQSYAYACAYLEKRYKEILDAYRGNEPAMPAHLIKSLPPLKSELDEKTVERVVEMRESENASFVKIAKELRITCEKARHTYEWYYHKKVLALIEELKQEGASPAHIEKIEKFILYNRLSAKKRYELLIKK